MPDRLKVYFLAVDPATPIERRPRAGLMQGREIPIPQDEQLGNGPSCSRVEVVDRDPDSGELVRGAPLLPAGPRRVMPTHALSNRSDIFARDFQQVSVFGAVRTTMALFESPGVLGRRLSWGFEAPKLKVIPRAGKKANALYRRESGSLEFFFFDGVIGGKEETVYTCLSPDIVAHETAHAIFDGIAPDLYDATAPQSLGVHEAVSDLTAMIFAATSHRLTKIVLEQNRGNLRQPGAFNAIAEQFGRARSGRIQPLRDLLNDLTLSDVPATPHALSEVLTGALYQMFLFCYERELDEAVARKGDTPENRYSESGAVLSAVARRFARISLRGLDYLPPGEVSFADYVRAIIAADTASNPESPLERDFLVKEAVRRGIFAKVEDAAPLPWAFNLDHVNLDALVQDDNLANQFAQEHREALHVPTSAAFEVRPRLDVTKSTVRRGNIRQSTRELIFKVTWASAQTMTDAAGLLDRVEVRHGTTLAIHWDKHRAHALLTTNPETSPSQDRVAHSAMRSTWLAANLADGTLNLSTDAVKVGARSYRFKGTMRQLHLAGRAGKAEPH